MSLPTTPPYWPTAYAGVHFGIQLQLTSNTFPEWSPPERRWHVLELMNGGIVRQLMGTGPSTVTYGIEVEGDTDVRALMAAMVTGEPADLVLYEGTTWQDGDEEVVGGEVLERYADVYLIGFEPVEREVEGASRWLATFERAVDE